MPITIGRNFRHRNSSFQFLWRQPEISSCFRSGVSLHSHTMFSEESLAMVPQYTHALPYVSTAIRRQTEKYCLSTCQPFQFADAFWTPPFAPRQAYRLEEKQIRRQFYLPALVSLTDHDDIRAGLMLRILEQFAGVPVSIEWTIPYRGTFFHLGVHNLAASDARQIAAKLAAFRAKPDETQLKHLLAMLNSDTKVLLVLNHPLWDENDIGPIHHRAILEQLLKNFRHYFHALELNGLRDWRENHEVITLANQAGLPLVSGGDRHGREPNATLNLSQANTFEGFVHEIRQEGLSHVVFMRQYREPIRLRILQTMVDVVREYPENVNGRRNWSDRVFYRDPNMGTTVPLSKIWKDGGPLVVKQFVAAMRLLEWRGVRAAMRAAFHDRTSTALMDSEAA